MVKKATAAKVRSSVIAGSMLIARTVSPTFPSCWQCDDGIIGRSSRELWHPSLSIPAPFMTVSRSKLLSACQGNEVRFEAVVPTLISRGIGEGICF
ncbi:hypothetical protein BDW75DRAFT_214060 [Aspergillus navahoensis]